MERRTHNTLLQVVLLFIFPEKKETMECEVNITNLITFKSYGPVTRSRIKTIAALISWALYIHLMPYTLRAIFGLFRAVSRRASSPTVMPGATG